jgi:hypothetical protein
MAELFFPAILGGVKILHTIINRAPPPVPKPAFWPANCVFTDTYYPCLTITTLEKPRPHDCPSRHGGEEGES